MFDTKLEVDKHVDNCLKKISDENERNLRSFAFAKLYFKVGDYEQARRYVSCYLAVKPHSTEGLNLLGKILEKQSKLELAVEAYRKSLDLDLKQNSLVIKICELLASDEVGLDLSGARYYCEKALLFDPHNPIVFCLKERLIAAESQDPNDVSNLLLAELASRPTDVYLRVRLLRHLLQYHRINEAYKHVCDIEQKNIPIFANSLSWYETVADVLVLYQHNNLINSNLTWEFWMLMVSVLDKLVTLTLAEHTNSLKNTSECTQVLFNFDQTLTTAVENISICNEKPLLQEFLNHYKAQLCFHFVTLLFKQVKRDLIKYKEAMQIALPLLFASYHAKPTELQCMWLDYSSEVRRQQVHRWHREAAFRCSQAGHILLAIAKDRKLTVIEKAVQGTSGLWREQLFKKLFITRDQQVKLKTSYFVSCPNFVEITIRLPEMSDVVKFDEIAELLYPDSLHHLIWICMHQKLPTFRCTVFEGLQYSIKNLNNCGAESLNLLDIESFLYCASLCVQLQQEEKKLQTSYNREHPNIYPSAVADLLGTTNQTKWLKAAYKMYRNEYGAELSELRLNLIRGIEVVRCVGNHGLDVKLLVLLAAAFTERAKNCTKQSEIEFNDARAELYWKAALPLLEKLEKNQAISYASNRLFEYKSKEMTHSDIMSYIDDGKLFIASQFMKKKDYEKALRLFESIKSPYASFHQAFIYKTMANDQMAQHKESVTSEMRSQHVILLSRARDCLYLTVDRLRDPSIDRKHPLNTCLGTEIEKMERLLSRFDSDMYNRNDVDGMSDENVSSAGSMGDHINNSYFSAVGNSFHYNEPVTPIYENRNVVLNRIRFDSARKEARPSPERLDAQLRQMQASKDATINQVLDQNRLMIESHRCLVDELRSFKDAVTILTSTVEDLKTQKNSVNDELKSIKDSVTELKTTVGFNFTDVSDVIQEMRKEISELKKDQKHNPLSEEDLYALDDEYSAEYNFTPNNLYPNLPGRLPNSSVSFPPTLYPGLYPVYPYTGLGLPQGGTLPFGQEVQLNDLRVLNSISQGLPQPTFVQPPLPAGLPQVKPVWELGVPQQSSLGVLPTTISLNQQHATTIFKDSVATNTNVIPSIFAPVASTSTMSNNSINISTLSKKAPVNVVITSSDPLPTTSIQTTQVLSVTIPPQHLKGKSFTKTQPHDYQISLPNTAITTLPETPAIMNQPSPIISTEGLLSNIAPPIYSAVDIKSPSRSTELGLHIESTLTSSFNSSKGDSFTKNISITSIDEHDPRPDFKPVVSLPDEVAVTTGEENEKILFSEQAKLYRFVNKEWRERGVGGLKILKNNETAKVRILMRRDIVHKICANHYLTYDMVLSPMPKNEKAYIWAANDFTDGEIVLEKLCVMFKTKEQALSFFDAFEKAKADLPNTSSQRLTGKQVESALIQSKDASNTIDVDTGSEKNKSLGGFIFTSTPTFKTLEPETTKAILTPDVQKNSPFATFTFGSKTTTKSTSLFPTNPVKVEINTPPKFTTLHSPKTPDEFIPTAEFTPIVTLPEFVDVKTGEENAEILFEERAKLLRFDTVTKEWKERGTGNIKLLKQNYTVRLLMRREQVHKVCCNHQLLKKTLFSRPAKNPKALTWSVQDYSENVFKTEIFTIKFKTEEQADAFLAAIESAQNSLDDSNCIKFAAPTNRSLTTDNRNDEKKIKAEPKVDSKVMGFDDKFKPKPGHWECKNCYITNEGKCHSCVACETPKPASPRKSTDNSVSGAQFSFGTGNIVTPTDASKSQFSFGLTKPSTPASSFLFGQKSVPATTLSWGDEFKPKEGSWECSQCLLRNDSDKLSCMSCEYPKDNSTSSQIKSSIDLDATQSQFRFGLPSEEKSTTVAMSSWGDAFKPKEGTWECKLCYVRNDGEKLYCLSCDSPKDDTVSKKDKTIDGSTSGFQFKFGIPQVGADTSTTFNFAPQSATDTFTFGIPQSQTTPSKSVNFSSNKNENEKSDNGFVFGSPQQHAFEFTPHSPRRHSSGCQGDEESDNYIEDEGEHIYFKPVIPLPEKIEIKSGEEDEKILYCQRAKLYRFVHGEWKERGIGDIKILLMNETGKLRVLMRREQVLKICLNHNLTPEMEYSAKDEKTWLFSAPDYSDGEMNYYQFCVRFKNAEVALGFKNAIDSALSKTKSDSDSATVTIQEIDSDIEFVSETTVTAEEEEEALALKLPKMFMSYRKLPDCTCKSCKNEDRLLSEFDALKQVPAKFAFGASTIQSSQNKSETLKSILIKPSLLASSVAFQSEKPAPTSNSTNLFSPKVIGEKKSSFNSFSFTLKTDVQSTPTTVGSLFTQSTLSTSSAPTFTFNQTITKPNPISTSSLFTTPTTIGSSTNIFGGASTITFVPPNKNLLSTMSASTTPTTNVNIFSDAQPTSGASNTTQSFGSLAAAATNVPPKEIVLKCDSNLSFATIASNNFNAFSTQSSEKSSTPFASLGAGTPVFASLARKENASKSNKDGNHSGDEAEVAESSETDHDPHYEPVIPLPEVVVVSTGEEEEITIFNERTKVYRYDHQTKEWKERGVGQLKILHHPVKGTYRFLLRREQVHKVVLNMLISPDLDIKPMPSSDKAWLWFGHNHCDGETALEKIAARFKSCDIAKHFYNAAIQAISVLKDKQETKLPSTVQNFEEITISEQCDESVEDDDDEEDDEDDDDDRSVMFKKTCIFSEELENGEWKEVCTGTLELGYDPEVYGSRIYIFNNSGELVSNSIIGMNTEITVQDNNCVWKAVDWVDYGNIPHWRTIKITFDDMETTESFHCSFLESIQFAHESQLVDGIFIGGEINDVQS